MSNMLDFLMSDDTAVSMLDKLKSNLKNRPSGPSNIFYNYRKNLPFDGSSTIRFLPASAEIAENDVQPDFWVPKKLIRLRFDNPEQEGSEVILPIPVMQMYVGGKNENDPILKQVQVLFEEADALKKKGREEESKQVKARASYHWMRGECIAQGFVNKSGFTEQDEPENPIRLFELNKQIMKAITSTLNSDDAETKLEAWPCHGKFGTNFVIKKTRSDEYPNYTTSCFARATSRWTDAQAAAFAKYGLWDLHAFLPAKPTDDEYAVLTEIVRMSIAGERVWDPDWEQHFETVKVYKTNQTRESEEGDGDAENLQTQIRDTMSKLGGASSTTSDVLNSLRTGRPLADADVDETAVITNEDEDGAPSVEKVQNVVDRIKKRTAGRTATA